MTKINQNKKPKTKTHCKKTCRKKSDKKKKNFRDDHLSEPTAVSGVSVFSNSSYYSTNNFAHRAKRNKSELNTVKFHVPDKCMYIVWQRRPKKKYTTINAYDIGERYIWRDEICDRLKRGRKSVGDEEFDEIGHAALRADILEAIEKVERNYFVGICDGSVIKVNENLYVWRIDISHIEDEIVLAPRSKLKTSTVIANYLPRFYLQPWRRFLHVYNFFQRCNLLNNHF